MKKQSLPWLIIRFYRRKCVRFSFLSRFFTISLLFMAPGFNSPAYGNNALNELNQLDRQVTQLLNDFQRQYQQKSERIKRIVQQQQQQQQCNNQNTNGNKTLWQKLNTPPEPYRSRYPNDPKRAWREFHKEQERIRMENSR